MYVTDTHPLIWHAQGKTGRMGKQARRLFDHAEQGSALIYVPSVVLWEISLLSIKGKLRFTMRFDQWCRQLQDSTGFEIHLLEWEDIHEAREMPFSDPFDGMIAATAARLNIPLITKDVEISESGKVETIWN
jgi:PIN domain nuclease of toxin-antitoxin system